MTDQAKADPEGRAPDLPADLVLPPHSWALGPSHWQAGRTSDRPTPVYAELADVPEPTEMGPHPVAPWALIHAGWLLDREPAGVMAGIQQRAAAHLPVLIGGRLPPEKLVELGRRGLHAVVEEPAAIEAWQDLTRRIHAEDHDRSLRDAIREESEDLRRNLSSRRSRLRGEAADLADELVHTQQALAAANSELKDHMAQLSLLYRFGRELSAAPNWDDTLESLLRSLTEFVGAAGAALILRSAPGGRYAARRTYRWDESHWDKVLLSLHGQVDAEVAESMLAPGVFHVDARGGADDPDRRIVALPLEHQDLRLGYLLLLRRPEGDSVGQRFLPFLQTMQMVLSEEVAAAQMLDRMRSIGSFNARVLETVSSGIWVLDDTGRAVYCNRAGRELVCGHPVAVDPEVEVVFAIGRGRGRLRPGDDAGEGDAEEELPEILRAGRLRLTGEASGGDAGREGPGGEPGFPGPTILEHLRGRDGEPFAGDATIRRDDGVTVPVRIQTAPMPGRFPTENWLVVVAEDQREARKAEAERLRADRLEGLVELSAGLAHEIRNPLMGLSAQAELLADRLPTGDKRARYLDMITTEVGRIEGTITRLLSFVRPYEPTLAPAVVPALGADCLELVRPRAAAKNVALATVVASSAPADRPLEVDAAQIKQVLINLLINAIDAAPAGGRVELAVAEREGIEVRDARGGTSRRLPGLEIAVRDDGPGIPPAVRAKIFRPFFTTKSAGTGLGLAISHKIVTAHGGDIAVAREDDRTVFRVLLPRTAGTVPSARRQEAR